MEFTNLFTDEDAVSPVIGVILMVAITVILAAVIGAFVLGIGSSQEKAPQASLDFSYDSGTVDITHDGGETLQESSLDVFGSYSGGCSEDLSGSSTFSAGSTLATCSGSTGETIGVRWTSSSGDSTQTLGESTFP
jgi:flagellin-like protein